MTDLPRESPIVNIQGNRVALGPMSKDLLPLFTHWINDFSSQLRVGFPLPGPVTAEYEDGWYNAVSTGPDRTTFVIRERETMAAIGSTALHNVEMRHRTATFGIMIGEPNARGKGYGTETARLMLDYGFTVLGLHSIDLTVAGFNVAGQKAYARAGFHECGRLRERIWFAGRRWDQILMDCLVHEFESPILAGTVTPD